MVCSKQCIACGADGKQDLLFESVRRWRCLSQQLSVVLRFGVFKCLSGREALIKIREESAKTRYGG